MESKMRTDYLERKERQLKKDEFFMFKPDKRLMEEMRDIVVHFLNYSHTFKEKLTSPAFKKSLPYKIAVDLEREEVSGWKDFQPHHL